MEQQRERQKDWILFLNEKGMAQDSFVYIEHFDASFVKFKLHEDDDTTIILPTRVVLKIKDRRVEDG